MYQSYLDDIIKHFSTTLLDLLNDFYRSLKINLEYSDELTPETKWKKIKISIHDHLDLWDQELSDIKFNIHSPFVIHKCDKNFYGRFTLGSCHNVIVSMAPD